MKLAVFSDIHSNHIALQACIDSIEKSGVDGIVFLGDYVSDCPDPEKTIRMLRELGQRYQTWYIKGNREQYFIDHYYGKEDGWSYSSYKGSLLYTYEHLKKEDIALFESFPDHQFLSIPDTEPIMLVHGSPSNLRELMYRGAKNTKKYMEELPFNYMLCGHTHEQFVFEHKGKFLINPGSIGVAIGKRAHAHFAIIEWIDGRWDCELMEIPFDFNQLCQSFFYSDLLLKAGAWPDCIMKSIDTGINYGPLCAKMAHDFAIAKGVNVEQEGLPEEYWQMAKQTLGIQNYKHHNSQKAIHNS